MATLVGVVTLVGVQVVPRDILVAIQGMSLLISVYKWYLCLMSTFEVDIIASLQSTLLVFYH